MNYEGGSGHARGTFHWTLDFAWETAPHDGRTSAADAIKYSLGV